MLLASARPAEGRVVSYRNTPEWKLRPPLAKRKPKAVKEQQERQPEVVRERAYVPFDEEEAPRRVRPAPSVVTRTKSPDFRTEKGGENRPVIKGKPTMEEIFGPGGLLDRSMIGGYEHRPG